MGIRKKVFGKDLQFLPFLGFLKTEKWIMLIILPPFEIKDLSIVINWNNNLENSCIASTHRLILKPRRWLIG